MMATVGRGTLLGAPSFRPRVTAKRRRNRTQKLATAAFNEVPTLIGNGQRDPGSGDQTTETTLTHPGSQIAWSGSAKHRCGDCDRERSYFSFGSKADFYPRFAEVCFGSRAAIGQEMVLRLLAAS